ncbi:tellurite resistance TerB family protein [Fulvivirga lutea]|uniref:TerB family tellurite resistance protein n=1 Tax=Fulvivirga lutea TaxID=2810512 RepID=A0A974ZZK8_9BACT|nr:TerB family tellurite resistance protein [Fulvivirga lutea]QSE96246.1 TerB family tellurite resistance protein [Fulvivirga lutea]
MRNIKLEHFQNLVSVAFADGHVEDSEREFLEDRAEELGLPAEEISKIMERASELKFIVPDDLDDREEQLADVVFMSMIDGEIEQKEYDLCLNIAERLELKKSDLDEVIALTKRLWKT